MALERLVALEVGKDKGRPDGRLAVGVCMPGQAIHGERSLAFGQGEDHGDGRLLPCLALKALGDRYPYAVEGDVLEHSRVHRPIKAPHKGGDGYLFPRIKALLPVHVFQLSLFYVRIEDVLYEGRKRSLFLAGDLLQRFAQFLARPETYCRIPAQAVPFSSMRL